MVVNDQEISFFSLDAANAAGLGDASKLPSSIKILLENLLRWQDGRTVTGDDVSGVLSSADGGQGEREISFRPARVLMQDFTGVPAVVDLAAMRDAMVQRGAKPSKINPLVPVDLVIDHSVMVDSFGSGNAMHENVVMEYRRNRERYGFLRWGQQAFDNFRVVPPGTGICHQVNLEYLSQVVWTSASNGATVAYPDTVVGTDSHTTMVNELSVLGWGVGGIEAEAAMLGQPISMLVPDVVGFRLTGALAEGATATDLVLTITQMLRQHGVVGKFVEFFGPALAQLTIADQATIANMAPEYGATCGFFPITKATLDYLKFTARKPDRIALVEAYAKEQGLWSDETTQDPTFTDTLELDLSTVEPSLAGPKRPQDRIALSAMASSFASDLKSMRGADGAKTTPVENANYELSDGAVVIAAITSCTNTSNPSVLIGAGLLARNARRAGLTVKPWVKTSFAPGSQVVSDYLGASGLQDDLDALGFNVVGYGCTTCIGNSGPLPTPIQNAIDTGDLGVAAVLSGNRNFEGRIHPQTKYNYLASPPLVVAYALAGNVDIDLYADPIGQSDQGNPVYLRDIWPSNQDIHAIIGSVITPEMYAKRYADVFAGDQMWQALDTASGDVCDWEDASTYVRSPTFFGPDQDAGFSDIVDARPLAILGDSVTTDHISPAGSIKKDSPAGAYLLEKGVPVAEFNSYGARRGNHEVMMRGTFANIRIRNEMAPGTEGGVTKHMPSGDVIPIYDAATRYQKDGVPLVVIAGTEYGTGSSRDWAAKGTRLLGVKAVIVESFERIHRSNLVGMGILPLQFPQGVTRKTLGLDGSEIYSLSGLNGDITPRMTVTLSIRRANGSEETVELLSRIDTLDEIEYFRSGGILQYVMGRLAETG
jgi:aconitate hydratase